MTLESGTKLGRYEILGSLGVGGMGEVYRARDERLHRNVAIKVLKREAVENRVRLQRFESEAKSVSALNHPNILTLHEIGESEFGPFIVTELVDGKTIREALTDGPLPLAQALDIAHQAASGLAKAHGSGIVHRDLKPENLMVTRDGFVKILDFGLAKLRDPEADLTVAPGLTSTGTIVGTVGYLSPEQLHGDEADYQSDIFALGVILFEILTGKNPFQRDTTAATLSAILLKDPPALTDLRPDAPQSLGQVLAMALKKKPEDRVSNAADLATELRRIQSALSTGHIVREPQPRYVRAVMPALAFLAVVAMVVVGIMATQVNSPSPPERKSRTSVAVLPINDNSGDSDLARANIGQVLTDGFVRILSNVQGVYVVSPFLLNGVAGTFGRPITDTIDDPAFARAVSEGGNANAMLTGSLSRVGEVFVLNATMIELGSDRLIGAFRAESQDRARLLQQLTDSVSVQIQETLGETVPQSGGLGIESVATSTLEAYTSFIRGRDYMEQGEWEEAVPELQTAVALDGDMGLAWTALACAFSFAGEEASSQAAQKKAEEFIDQVNEKERRWIELNGIWINTGNGPKYRLAADAFIRDFPDDREGYYYAGLGAEYLEDDCEDALGYYEQAFQLTPAFYSVTSSLVDCNRKLGRSDRAIAVLRRFLDLPMISDTARATAEARLTELEQSP